MNIRTKTILIFGLTLMLLISGSLYVTNFYVKKFLLLMEDGTAKQSIELAQQELRHEVHVMAKVNQDWATWTPTYNFASNLNPDYVGVDLTKTFLDYQKINIFIILNSEGDPIYEFFYNLPDNQDDIAQILRDHNNHIINPFRQLSALDQHSAELAGFLFINDFPLVLSGRHIVRSDSSGPSRGVLIMGRALDRKAISEMTDRLALQISLRPMAGDRDNDSGRSDAGSDLNISQHNGLFNSSLTIFRDDDHITSQTSVKCLDGGRMLLTVVDNRGFYKVGQKTTNYHTVAICLVGLFFSLTGLLFMEKVVLNPLTKFTRAVPLISRQPHFKGRLEYDGNDEIGQLAGNINQLMITLEDYQRETEKRHFQDLVESSMVGTIIVFHDRIVYLNPTSKEIFGDLPISFGIDNFISLNVHPWDREAFQIAYGAVKNDLEVRQDLECRVFKFDDSYRLEPEDRWIQLRAKKIDYQDQTAVLINLLDVSKFKKMEETLRIREKMVSLGNISTGIAHEIRNPLSSIAITLDSLLMQESIIEHDPEIVDILSRARQDVQTISGVIKRVMDFARPSHPSMAPSSINSAIENVILLSKTSLKHQKVKLITDLSPDLPEIMINRQLVEELILNLINNAMAAMEGQVSAKIIQVTSRLIAGEVRINVTDSGPGIQPGSESQIFDPFFTTKRDGSGIGLNICQRIIIDHGGDIKLVPARLKGAEFQISFPIINAN